MNRPEQISYSLSKPFITFLSIFVLVMILGITCFLHRSGGDWKGFLLGSVVGIAALVPLFSSLTRLIKQNFTEWEKSAAQDIQSLRVTQRIKRYIFPDMDIGLLVKYVVGFNSTLRWTFFILFFAGMVFHLLLLNVTVKTRLTDIIFLAVLAFLWFPLVENRAGRGERFKIFFPLKIVLTALTLFLAIMLAA